METSIITRNYKTERRTCIRVPLPTAEAQRLIQGYNVLDRYPILFNEKGQQLVQRAEQFFATAEQLSEETAQNYAQELLDQFPVKDKPHLELFVQPDLSLLQEAAAKGLKSVKLEIIYGCENNCIFCLTDPPQQLSFMPYPMILAIANAVRAVGGMASISFDRSEPLQYRDAAFGANLSDILKNSDGLELYCPSTHGWPEKEKYARAAAEEIKRQGIAFEAVSVHLLHDELLRPDVPAEIYEKYTRRFVEAISLLRPRKIGLRGLRGRDVPAELGHLSLGSVANFFHESVMPNLPTELQSRFREDKFSLEHRDITRIREKHGRVLPKSLANNRRAGIRGWQFTNDLALLGLSEMIVSVDGHYRLVMRGEDLEAPPVQKGNLFN